MFYLWPIDRCSNSRTALCWQSARFYIKRFMTSSTTLHIMFSSRKPGDSYPKIDRSRRTLAKNDLPSSGADVWIPREMGFPYIYIYCISISRVFWRFLTFFARFWILSIFCALYPEKGSFFDGSFFPLWYGHFLDSIFSVPFKEMGFGFYRFFVFWPFFTFFGSFYFFWIVCLFYRFFIDFWFFRFLSNVASVGRFFFGFLKMWKKWKKSKKVEKMTFFGVQKKGSKLDLFVPPPFLVKNRVFWPPNSPPSGYFSKIGPLTTVVFLYSPCSCRRGRSVWRQLFSPLFPGTLL